MEQRVVGLTRVPAGSVPEIWPLVRERLERTSELWDATETIESIFLSLSEDVRHLWRVHTPTKNLLFVITEFLVYPKGKVLSVVWTAGEEAALSILTTPAMESFAQLHRCIRIEVRARPAFAKLLRPFGYAEEYRALVKELNYGQV